MGIMEKRIQNVFPGAGPGAVKNIVRVIDEENYILNEPLIDSYKSMRWLIYGVSSVETWKRY